MAKKDKVGLIPSNEAAAQRPGGIEGTPSNPVGQATPAQRDSAKTPEQAAAASPSQMENAMVQQILERQAVFGF